MSNSNLNKHLQAKQDNLTQLEQSIKDIQLQLATINQELRVQQQLAKAQESIAKEFKTVKASLTKLLKDSCSCYEPEALDDMLLDLSEIVESVKADYASYQVSDRFLNSETSYIEDTVETTDTETAGTSLTDIPLLASPLPPRDDDKTILTNTHILSLIDFLFLGIDELQRVQSVLGIPGKFRKIETLAMALSQASLTSAKFYSIVELMGIGKNKTLSINGSNGNSGG
jgi:hypothetical protein